MTGTLRLLSLLGFLTALLAGCDTPPDPGLMEDEAQMEEFQDMRGGRR